MPSAVSPLRSSFLKPPHEFSKPSIHRHRSTSPHESSSRQANELLSALLHGQKQPGYKASQVDPSSAAINRTKRSIPSTPQASHLTPSARKGVQAPRMAADRRGQKRKAHEPLQSPPSRRRKQNPSSSASNISFQEEPLPTAQQHPDLPPRLFSHPKETIHNLLQGYATLSSNIIDQDKRTFLCRLRCVFADGGEVIGTEGRATSRKAAEKAAYAYFAVKFGHNESLKSRLAVLQIDKVDSSVLKEQKDAKLDIYNYAARFDAIPEISERILLRSHRQKGGKIYEVTVKLSSQDIEATARGTNPTTAEVAAALRFKEAAEKYQAKNGDQSLVIKDSTALTTENSGKFFEFYKMKNPGAVVDVRVNYGEGRAAQRKQSSGQHPTQITLDGKLIGQEITATTKQQAEELAFLTAAIELKAQNPTLFPEFVQALAAGNGVILKPVKPITLNIDEESQLIMRETLLNARKAGLPDKVEDLLSDEQEASRARQFRRQLSPQELTERTRHLEHTFAAYRTDPRHSELRCKKDELPLNQYRARVLDLISNNSYSIVVGATGSGKTTQVPQILLEDAILKGSGATCNVICTQPRRIAATSVARRVAAERGERLQDTVGYHVRFDTKLPSYGGSITYCTTGILLQQLQHSPEEVMNGVSHLVIDEVHERDMLIDFLLILLKKAMTERHAAGKTTPKVVLMSATMDTELFASYFGNEAGGKSTGCPSLSVPGRTFPVKEKYLEEIQNELNQAHSADAHQLLQKDPATTDYLAVENDFKKQHASRRVISMTDSATPDEFVIDWKSERKLNAEGEIVTLTEREDAVVPLGLVATTIAHISKTTETGAVLVFLPGLEEMTKVNELLTMQPFGLDFRDASRFKVHLLHSSIPAAQTEVFNEVPLGCRKIILSTNIAETSVTIPDVQYVVDTGKLREKQYDPLRRITQLKCTWISKSNAKQRAGRAGRVQNGNYYALFTAERYHTLRAVGLPEMLRTDLQETCLDIKAQAFNYPIRSFLAEALEPPSPQSVDASVLKLQALGALTAEEQITPLGRLLASLPVHPSLGKMILLGVVFRCLDPMLVLGAAAGERSLFISPLDKKREAKQAKYSFAKGSVSDHIGLLNAIREMRHIRDRSGEYAMRQYAHENFIHNNAFKTIDSTVKQIEEILVDARLIPYTPEHARRRSENGDPYLNENSSSVPLIKALAIAGFHPNLAVSTGGPTHRTPGEANTIMHPSSINATARAFFRSGRDDASNRGPRYGTLYTYSAMSRSNDGNSVFLRDTTECSPLMAALFGGRLALSKASRNILNMDDWLPFYARSDAEPRVSPSSVANTVLQFRAALDRVLAGAFTDLKGSRERAGKGAFLAEDKVRAAFAEGLVEVLDREDQVNGAKAGGGGGVEGVSNPHGFLGKRSMTFGNGDGRGR
ncbi:MAG: hypothetical protein Q9177_004008 [Variospora cf. flavescens]